MGTEDALLVAIIGCCLHYTVVSPDLKQGGEACEML